ncbi:hypothetical protein GIB67_010036 [Kingdonia uniflora]|uniref:Uncharacterized protein n=1 Tax=Kingdonia uniflora TaxID=39325 RepID=A0A7J7KV78_9MAGN|nr:hypothetical protein GIB67_010036 [Kingdonia uniflora]
MYYIMQSIRDACGVVQSRSDKAHWARKRESFLFILDGLKQQILFGKGNHKKHLSLSPQRNLDIFPYT